MTLWGETRKQKTENLFSETKAETAATSAFSSDRSDIFWIL